MSKNFAKIENGIVVDVIVVPADSSPSFFEEVLKRPGQWVEYSLTGEFRKQVPILGSVYDEGLDVFILPRPYASWSLDANNDWQAPVSLPGDSWTPGSDTGMVYIWEEESQSWIGVSQL